jgi:hypothetical protein
MRSWPRRKGFLGEWLNSSMGEGADMLMIKCVLIEGYMAHFLISYFLLPFSYLSCNHHQP